MGVARAGIPGVAGRLGLPAKTIVFWKRAVFFARKRVEEKNGVCFAFGGCFCAFGGIFVLFFCFRASA